MEVLRLFPAVQQFQVKNGALNTDGRLYVYLNGTDDLAECFDADGSRIAQPVILDNNGRAPGLFVDSSKVYRLVVQDRYGNLLFTVRDMVPAGGGAGSSLGKTYDVVSLDGSIAVDKSVDAGVTTYDIGLAPSSDEFLEWIKCSEEDCGTMWYPVFQDGTMETEAGQGVKVHKGHLYHFTNSFTVDPDGTGVNYDTFRVIMYCGDEEVDMREFDIDSSLNDSVLCEFSRDVVPTEDSHVYFKLTIPSTCEVTGEVQCHRIYSGINAVPDTCATKQWVQETFDYNLSSKVDYSAIGYNGQGQISGISGSAIAGGLDSASVSSIASSVASAYTESAFSSLSSKADSSALTAYQPLSAMSGYATTAYVDGRVSGKLDVSAFNSGDFYSTANPSGFITGVDLIDYATTGYVDSSVSGKLDTSAFNSGDFYLTSNPSGFITGVDLTPYQEKSAMTAYQPSGDYYSASNPSGFITGVDLSDYATTGFVESAASGKLDTSAFASASAGFAPAGDYAFNSAVSSKLDASASGDFVMNSAMTSWIPYSALGYSGTAISGIGGSSLAGMGGGDYTGIYPVNVDNDTREIAVDSMPLITDSSMTAYASAGSSVIGVNLNIMSAKQDTLAFAYNTANQISSINGSALGGMDEAAVSGIASAYAQSAASSKLDTTAFNSADFYSTANPSGFIDSAYVDSAVSGKLDASASSSFYSTANESGFITGVDLSPYQTTAGMSGYIPTSLSSDFQQVTGMSSYALSSDVSGTVDLVSTQSANWGGSALALSAGPGVKLKKSGNTLVASTDEMVLFSGQTAATATMNLNEAYTNFEYIDLIGHWDYNGTDRMCAYNRIPTSASIFSLGGIGIGNTAANSYDMFMCANEYSSNGTSVAVRKVIRINLQTTLSSNSDGIIVDKIIGINRTAEA